MVVISIFFLLEEIAWTLSWLSFAEIKWCAAFAPLMLKFLDSFGYLSLFPWKELQIWCAQLWMTDCHSIQKRHRKAWVPLTSILKCGSRFGWLESRGKGSSLCYLLLKFAEFEYFKNVSVFFFYSSSMYVPINAKDRNSAELDISGSNFVLAKPCIKDRRFVVLRFVQTVHFECNQIKFQAHQNFC